MLVCLEGVYDRLRLPFKEPLSLFILLKGNLIRVYCGLEDSKDQINDILNALKVLK